MMLAGLPVANEPVHELAALVHDLDASEVADRRERALADEVKLLAKWPATGLKSPRPSLTGPLARDSALRRAASLFPPEWRGSRSPSTS